MVEKKVNQKQAKNSKTLGYDLKGVPFWVFSVIKSHLPHEKLLLKSKSNVYPIMVLPPDFWVKVSFTNSSKSGKKLSAEQRLDNKNIRQKYLRLDENNLKQFSLELSKSFSRKAGGKSRLVLFMIPTKVVSAKVVDIEPKKELILGAIKPKSSRRKEEFHFFDNVDSSLSSYYNVRYREELYPITIVVDGVRSILWSKKNNYNINGIYKFLVSGWYEMRKNLDVPQYYNWEDVEIKENYDDAIDAILNKKVTCWDDISPQWAYDSETISIILSGITYMEKNVPTLNLIMFGSTGIGKSCLFQCIEKAFGERIISGSSASIKGITGSHVKDIETATLYDANFCALVDEIFRIGKKDNDNNFKSANITALLNGLIELLEHSEKVSSSGLGIKSTFLDKSMLCANNILDFNAFSKAWNEDPAPWNRINLLIIPDEIFKSMEKIQQTALLDRSNFVRVFEKRLQRKGLSIYLFRKIIKLARESMKNVQINETSHDAMIFSGYMNQVGYVPKGYEKLNRFKTLVKCCAVFNKIFEGKNPHARKFKPTDNDYAEAVKMMNRIVSDFKIVMGLKKKELRK